MSRIYFTADLHLGHELVANHRGYDSVSAHDATILCALFFSTRCSTAAAFVDSGRRDRVGLAPGLRFSAVAGAATARRGRDAFGRWQITIRVIRCIVIAHKQPRTITCRFLTRSKPLPRSRHNRRDVLLSHFPYAGDHALSRNVSINGAWRNYGRPADPWAYAPNHAQ